MQKRLVAVPEQSSVTEESWRDLEAMAQVELTSEDPANPIEGALLPNGFSTWIFARSPRWSSPSSPSRAEGRPMPVWRLA